MDALVAIVCVLIVVGLIQLALKVAWFFIKLTFSLAAIAFFGFILMGLVGYLA